MTVEIISGPTIETQFEIPIVGIRLVTPFKGMLRVRNEFLSGLQAWTRHSAIDVVEFGLLHLHVIDMQSDMDIEVRLVTSVQGGHGGRVYSSLFIGGRYATLRYLERVQKLTARSTNWRARKVSSSTIGEYQKGTDSRAVTRRI